LLNVTILKVILLYQISVPTYVVVYSMCWNHVCLKYIIFYKSKAHLILIHCIHSTPRYVYSLLNLSSVGKQTDNMSSLKRCVHWLCKRWYQLEYARMVVKRIQVSLYWPVKRGMFQALAVTSYLYAWLFVMM